MEETIKSAIEILISQEQDKILSKVCGRENYVIRLFDGKVIWYGTKGEWSRKLNHIFLLSEAVRYNDLKFTYKKDWLNALKELGVKI